MPFEIGYHVIGKQGDAGIGLDLPGIWHREYFVRNTILEKTFQILEQTESVDRIDC